mgnify:CR=1 FL=1
MKLASTLEEALDRIRNKNQKPVLRELGKHPDTGKVLQILKGRYGPYVTDSTVNANIGRDRDPEEVVDREADLLVLLAARDGGDRLGLAGHDEAARHRGAVAGAGDRVLSILALRARFGRSSFAQLGVPFVALERTPGT